MLLTTTSTLQDRHIDEYKGVVSGEAILGANAFRDMFAGIRDIVGGRSAAYERELQRAKDLAIKEMPARAPGHGSQRRHRHRLRLRDRGPELLDADGHGERDGRCRDVAQCGEPPRCADRGSVPAVCSGGVLPDVAPAPK